MLPMEKSVTFTGACANEIIPLINRSFVYKAKEGGHVRIVNIQQRLGIFNTVIQYSCNIGVQSSFCSVIFIIIGFYILWLRPSWIDTETIHLDDNQRNTTAKFAFKCFKWLQKIMIFKIVFPYGPTLILSCGAGLAFPIHTYFVRHNFTVWIMLV